MPNRFFYPADQTLTAIMALGSPEFKSERLYTIKQLMTEKPFIVVTTMQGLSQRQLTPKKDYERGGRTLLINRPVRHEGSRSVSRPQRIYGNIPLKIQGIQCRGSILDVFTLHNEYPYH